MTKQVLAKRDTHLDLGWSDRVLACSITIWIQAIVTEPVLA